MFQRGFKTRCEDLSLHVRQQLKVLPEAPLVPERLAEYLGVILWSLQDIAGLASDVRQRLEGVWSDEWSALTLVDGTSPVIVFNAAHSRRRRSSTLMHEFAHLMLEHTPGNMFFGQNGLALRTYEPNQESEANWLAGCLLLPRAALVAARKVGMSEEELCDRYGVSSEMTRFRINATGVDRQLAASDSRR